MNGAKEARQGQTTGQIEQLSKSISVISESVGHLTDRLSRTLRNQPPSSVVGEDKPADELVPMANSIRQLRHQVEMINNDVEDILNRLEL